MARFAHDCSRKTALVTAELSEKLGSETRNLSLRIGLHSGPATAGVLRGQRERFQLFWDSVNTASRMESCGKPGYVHCSQSTADALIAS